MSGEEIQKIINNIDDNGNGMINYSEFLAATMDEQIYLREDYLRTAFQMFDKDGSGKIDSQEVVALLSGEEMTSIVSKEAIE